MRFSDGVEWSVHSCLVLAALPEGVGLPGAKLAEFHSLPAAYLAKHMQALVRAGVVESIPGRHGGYRLARPASEITVADVVTAIEGNRSAFRCTEIRRQGPGAGQPCEYQTACLVSRVMGGAEQAWRSELSKWTLADLAFDPASAAYLRQDAWLSDVLEARG
ncbi:RrF2 family transcriptional regulator [Sinomonas terricola]|uniref:RrF2 family transcriptional regulator n=1 Tax=Sinomonas terricola TaxID=3110330 RepID=UPI003D1813FC